MTARFTKTKIKIHFLLTVAILPDIDFLIPGMRHRGPSHSMIIMVLSSLPFLITYGKTVVPYIIATVQHSLIGDYLGEGGIQLFWPLSRKWFGIEVCQSSTLNIGIEWTIFLTSTAIMLKLGDLRNILKPHPLNLTLIAPLISICSPLFLGFPARVPAALYAPHIAYLALFTLSLVIDFKELLATRIPKIMVTEK